MVFGWSLPGPYTGRSGELVLVVSDTLVARIVAELHLAGAYRPRYVEITALASILVTPTAYETAETAIHDLATSSDAPVIYADDTRTTVGLVRDPEAVFAWVEAHDPDEFPPSMG